MSGGDVFSLLWAVLPVLFGFSARESETRVSMPEFVGLFYGYLFWHALFFTLVTMFGIKILFFDANYYHVPGRNWGSDFFLILVIAISTGYAWRFWAFDRFYPDEPNRVPVGVQLWAELSPKALSSRQDGLVNTDELADRAEKRRPSRSEVAKAKAETHRAEVAAYELKVAKEYEDAQAELARTAREYNEAKLRAEEAQRRRDKL